LKEELEEKSMKEMIKECYINALKYHIGNILSDTNRLLSDIRQLDIAIWTLLNMLANIEKNENSQ